MKLNWITLFVVIMLLMIGSVVAYLSLGRSSAAGSDRQVSHLNSNEPPRIPAKTGDIEIAQQEVEHAEQRAVQAARENSALRGEADADAVKANKETLRLRVRREVKAAFDARQRLQRAELQMLREQLSRIEQSIATRAQIKDKIIDHRVQELLDPALRWNHDRAIQENQEPQSGHAGVDVAYPIGAPAIKESAGPVQDDIDQKFRELQGDWLFVSREWAGKPFEYTAEKKIVLSIANDRWETTVDDQRDYDATGRILMDGRTITPKQLTIITTDGPKEFTAENGGFSPKSAGIYEIVGIAGDTLKICLCNLADDPSSLANPAVGQDSDSDSRPTRFESDANNNWTVYKLKRVTENRAQRLSTNLIGEDPGELIYNDRLKRFKFRLEKIAVENEYDVAEMFWAYYRARANPEITGAWGDPKSNSIVVVGVPEADQAIRQTIAEWEAAQIGIDFDLRQENNLESEKRSLQAQHKELLEKITTIKLAVIDAEADGKKSDGERIEKLNGELNESRTELEIVERKLEVIGVTRQSMEQPKTKPSAASQEIAPTSNQQRAVQ